VEPPNYDQREGCVALGGLSTLSSPRYNTQPGVGCRGLRGCVLPWGRGTAHKKGGGNGPEGIGIAIST
jgi:hypothetical protein